MRAGLSLFAMLAVVHAAQAQGVPLDKLNNCATVTEASAWLGSSAVAGDNCRPARDDAEKRLLADWSSALGTKSRQSCIASAPVLATLKEFTCATSRRDGKPSSLFCFRRVNGAPLRAYRENYALVYARRVAAYFAKGGQCPGVTQAGHKPRIAGVSLPSTDMLSIATPAFGYESRLRANGGRARLEHGFAFLDPKLVIGGKDAIEYLSVDNGDGYSLDRVVQGSQRAGDWTIDSARIDDVVAMAQDMAAGNSDLKRQLSPSQPGPADIELGALYLSVTSPNPTARGDTDKTALRKAWLARLGTTLASWHFDTVNKATLSSNGLDPAMLVNGAGVALPYGLKSSAAAQKPTFAGAWSAEKVACSHDGGGYLVLALDMPPPDGKRSEFGTVGFTIMAVGGCRHSAGGPGVAGLASRLTTAFASSTRGDPQ